MIIREAAFLKYTFQIIIKYHLSIIVFLYLYRPNSFSIFCAQCRESFHFQFSILYNQKYGIEDIYI